MLPKLYGSYPLAKGSPLLAPFTKGIQKIIETGTLHRIVSKYEKRGSEATCKLLSAGKQESLGFEHVFPPFFLMGSIVALG